MGLDPVCHPITLTSITAKPGEEGGVCNHRTQGLLMFHSVKIKSICFQHVRLENNAKLLSFKYHIKYSGAIACEFWKFAVYKTLDFTAFLKKNYFYTVLEIDQEYGRMEARLVERLLHPSTRLLFIYKFMEFKGECVYICITFI